MKFFTSVIVHIYKKEHFDEFKYLINHVLKGVNGIHITDVTKLMYQEFGTKQRDVPSFFNSDECVWWRKYWKNMPTFFQKNLRPFVSVRIYFTSKRDVEFFTSKTGQSINERTKYIHFPKSQNEDLKSKICIGGYILPPKYPIYIISKGRWESRLTSKALEKMGVPYYIVIEPQEYDQYAAVIAPEKILVLPFSNLGQGSIPARNWVWEHSISIGAKRHWILDDNIRDFYRLHENIKWRIYCPNVFRAIEHFVDRYQNIGLAGMHYEMFIHRRGECPPFQLNTRIYSCILIRNDLPHRWRGKYNEDTDLSLRVLKDGECTILFNTFLCDKMATMQMKGGNTKEVYGDTDNRIEFAESLKKQHPELVKVTKKFGRWHHHVDYSIFKQCPKEKAGISTPNKMNEFGMKLITRR